MDVGVGACSTMNEGKEGSKGELRLRYTNEKARRRGCGGIRTESRKLLSDSDVLHEVLLL